MKKIIFLLFILAFALMSCSNQTSNNEDDASNTSVNKEPDTYQADLQKLNDVLKKYEEPSQTFNIPSNKPSQVKGKQGTIILVNPANLLSEKGKLLGKTIDIELKELCNQQQLLKTNAQTVSNGQLLVSGGAYYINMTSDGQQLKIKEGMALKVEFPKK